MPFKILKDAGVVPREVEMFRERAELAKRLQACIDLAELTALSKKLSELEQAIALRLEALRINPSCKVSRHCPYSEAWEMAQVALN